MDGVGTGSGRRGCGWVLRTPCVPGVCRAVSVETTAWGGRCSVAAQSFLCGLPGLSRSCVPPPAPGMPGQLEKICGLGGLHVSGGGTDTVCCHRSWGRAVGFAKGTSPGCCPPGGLALQFSLPPGIHRLPCDPGAAGRSGRKAALGPGDGRPLPSCCSGHFSFSVLAAGQPCAQCGSLQSWCCCGHNCAHSC